MFMHAYIGLQEVIIEIMWGENTKALQHFKVDPVILIDAPLGSAVSIYQCVLAALTTLVENIVTNQVQSLCVGNNEVIVYRVMIYTNPLLIV